MPADETLPAGFVSAITDDLVAELEPLVQRIRSDARLMLWETKEALRRLQVSDHVDDDFADAVDAFMAEDKPIWTVAEGESSPFRPRLASGFLRRQISALALPSTNSWTD